MADVDEELVARTIRWCADAGRHTTPAQVRAALSPLTWDELIAARALLADPPPERPLGPFALADIAHGALPGVAAEREREHRYGTRSEDEEPSAPVTAQAGTRTPGGTGERRSARGGRGSKQPRALGPVVRHLRARAEHDAVPTAPLPRLEELFASEGRPVLERLMRQHGARRAPIVAALVAGWRRGDTGDPTDEDLARLLDAHGLARAFEARERDELLHALRAAGGVVARAAATLSISPDAFRAGLERLGATREADAIRRLHREELRRQATLSERARLFMNEQERIADLDLLAEIESDLRKRLPEHVRAVRASSGEPLIGALARSLAAAPHDVIALGRRLGIDLGPGRTPERSPERSLNHPPNRPTRRPARTEAAGAQSRRPRGGPPARPRGNPRHGRPSKGR